MNRKQPISQVEKQIREDIFGEKAEKQRILQEIKEREEMIKEQEMDRQRIALEKQKAEEEERERQRIALEKQKAEEEERERQRIALKKQKDEQEERERQRIALQKQKEEQEERERYLMQERKRREEEEIRKKNQEAEELRRKQDQYRKNQEQVIIKQNLDSVSQLSESLFDDNLFNSKAQSIEQYQSNPKTNQVIQQIKALNSHLTTVTKRQVDSVINYQIVRESIQPLPIQKKQQLQNETESFRQQAMSVSRNVKIEQLNKQDQTSLAMVMLQQKLTQNGHEVYISNQNQPNNSANILKKQKISTDQQDDETYLSMKFENIQFDDFLDNKQKRDHLIQTLIKMISQNYNINPEDVQLVSANAGSADLTFQVNAPPGSKVVAHDAIVPFLQKHGVEYAPKSTKDLSISTKTGVSNFIISPSFFSPNYNMYWDPSHTNMVDYRGSIMYKNKGLVPQRYYFPVGYTGIAINVDEFTNKDKSKWFGSSQDPDTWIVLFHGTKNGGVKGILEQKAINLVSADFYANDECLINREKIKPGNVYFGEKVEVSSGYSSIAFNGITYEFIYQCRVDPKVVRCAQAGSDLYYLVNKEHQDRIRPYRFLIKQK